MEMCRKNNIKKVVYFSSSRVLNSEKNPYTASKLYEEELVKAYHRCYDIDYIIIRPSTVYGGNDITVRIVDIWIKKAKNNESLEVYGNSKKTLSFTSLSDFISGVIKSLDNWNTEYNISGIEEKLTKVASEIIKQTNEKPKISNY